MMTANAKDSLAINAIRTLGIDAIERANSGHPGIVMGAAPMAYALWQRQMIVNPKAPDWVNRDRFVLSAGHGSMLLYSLLHLSGYDVSIEDIKQFRRYGSKTPGHPEYGHTPGVDATTGPLGQGIAMSVGMAMAEAHLAATYNREEYPVIDHYTYALCGDGDLMEGVSAEAASLAGHLKLGKLIVLYDSNDICLDGELNRTFTESVQKRFKAYGWHYIRVEDQHDVEAINSAIEAAKRESDRPTLIEVKTTIGYGSPNKAGKGGSVGPHGSPLGKEESVLTKAHYGWTHEPFELPDEAYEQFRAIGQRGEARYEEWQAMMDRYHEEYPELHLQLQMAVKGELPQGWDEELPTYDPAVSGIATRAASGRALNAIASRVPYLVGGSADLASSNNTMLQGMADFTPADYSGRNIWFGVREFAMACAMNGMSLHGGVKVYGGTFFVFSDYLKPAIRMAAMMKLPVIYVLTHDSIAVGEDGPTHEPIEQLVGLRAIPGITVLRPADAEETNEAWRFAMEQQEGPIVLVLTRQNLPNLKGTQEGARKGLRKGAYIVSEAAGERPHVQLLATGSEVSLAVEAQERLEAEGIPTRVVSMPSWELFDRQSTEYRDKVIAPDVRKRLAIEMAHPLGWHQYVGDKGDVVGIRTFGASGDGKTIMQSFGFTADQIVERVKQMMKV
nr:transketolase [Paenibacillus faecalis]